MKEMRSARLVDIGDCELYVSELGDGFPLLILHGGPGLDHHEFADYLDPLADELRLIFVDQRAQGRSSRPPRETWTLQRMAEDVVSLARALELPRYAVLGHSYGALVTLQTAVDNPDDPNPVIVSSGVPSAGWFARVDQELARFEPLALREQVARSWERESGTETEAQFAMLMSEQMPFHFADPLDPRIADYKRRTADTVYAPDVLRLFAADGYGGIDVEDRLAAVRRPMLVIAGRHDRTCVLDGSLAIADRVPGARLVVLESSAHMGFVEETDRYLEAVRAFLKPLPPS